MLPDLNNHLEIMLYKKFKNLTHPERLKIRVEVIKLLERLEKYNNPEGYCTASKEEMLSCKKFKRSKQGCSTCRDNINRCDILIINK